MSAITQRKDHSTKQICSSRCDRSWAGCVYRPATATGAVEPLDTPRGQFFGDPENSLTWTSTDAGNIYITHQLGEGVTLRDRTRYAEYTKFYENVFTNGFAAAATNTTTATPRPGLPAGTYAAGTVVGIQAYNTLTERQNFINQTDLNAKFTTGGIKHTVLVGGELGQQKTDNIGQNGYFLETVAGAPARVATIYVPVSGSRISRNNIEWRNDRSSNFGTLDIAAGYIQDQIELAPQLQVIVGVRYEHLKTKVTNRQGTPVPTETFDSLWSPRAGLVFKPVENASVYASFSRSYLQRGGDQLASLAPNNRNLAPERYQNYELGAKWDLNPNLNVSAAIYQLDRDNVIVLSDPTGTNPSIPVGQTELGGGQRSRGVEFSIAGNVTPQLNLVGSYTFQEAGFIRAISATVREGAQIPNAPRHSGSRWARYDVTPALGIALGGIAQGERFAAQDNFVRLPGYARVDAAIFYKLSEKLNLQFNAENLSNTRYFQFAHSNSNIAPGAPTTVRGAINVKF